MRLALHQPHCRWSDARNLVRGVLVATVGRGGRQLALRSKGYLFHPVARQV